MPSESHRWHYVNDICCFLDVRDRCRARQVPGPQYSVGFKALFSVFHVLQTPPRQPCNSSRSITTGQSVLTMPNRLSRCQAQRNLERHVRLLPTLSFPYCELNSPLAYAGHGQLLTVVVRTAISEVRFECIDSSLHSLSLPEADFSTRSQQFPNHD